MRSTPRLLAPGLTKRSLDEAKRFAKLGVCIRLPYVGGIENVANDGLQPSHRKVSALQQGHTIF